MDPQIQLNQEPANSAKYAFFYMLSLVSLIFMAVSVGMIIFQIINKNMIEAVSTMPGCFVPGALKFAISAIIIAAPVYYIASFQINKNLFTGKLSSDSGVRKWLTYFILFISSVVIIGYLISIIYNFLDGELTIKFLLKTLTVLAISGGIFSFYLYDIRRNVVVGSKDKIVSIYFWISLAIVICSFLAGLFFAESPKQARLKRQDAELLRRFNSLKYAIDDYHNEAKKLPSDLEELSAKSAILKKAELTNPVTNKQFDYEILIETKYKICADFQTSNIEEMDSGCNWDSWLDQEWRHDKGYQCIEKEVLKFENER